MKHERKKLDSLKAEVLSLASKQEGNLCKLKGNNTLFRLSSSVLHAKRRLEKFMPFNAFIEPEDRSCQKSHSSTSPSEQNSLSRK
jgi:hypothetical protein